MGGERESGAAGPGAQAKYKYFSLFPSNRTLLPLLPLFSPILALRPPTRRAPPDHPLDGPRASSLVLAEAISTAYLLTLQLVGVSDGGHC